MKYAETHALISSLDRKRFASGAIWWEWEGGDGDGVVCETSSHRDDAEHSATAAAGELAPTTATCVLQRISGQRNARVMTSLVGRETETCLLSQFDYDNIVLNNQNTDLFFALGCHTRDALNQMWTNIAEFFMICCKGGRFWQAVFVVKVVGFGEPSLL